MKRRTAQKSRYCLLTSVILFSIIAGFVISPGSVVVQQSSDAGSDGAKPLAHTAPSYSTPGSVLYDDFSGSALGSDWTINPSATGKGATFSTSTKAGFLAIHTPSTDPPFEQSVSADNGAYAYVTLQGNLASMSTFTLETKVNYTKTKNGGYQVGLMIRFQDNGHMYFWGPYGEWRGSPNIYLGFSGYNKLLGPALPSFSETGAYYLRIVRNQSIYYFFASDNGINWVYAGSHNPYGATGASGPPTWVGLITKTRADKKPYAEVNAHFDYFRVTVEGEVKQATYPSTLYCGEPASIVGWMKYYHNTSYISSGKMGLIVDGNLDQVKTTDGSGMATFAKEYASSGSHSFTIFAINNTEYSLSSVVNKTFSITWIGYKVDVLVLDMDGQGIPGATVRLQNATTKEYVNDAQITNATGYCGFIGVKPSLTQDYLLNATFNIYESTFVKNDTVVFEVTDHTYKELTMRTSKTVIHVSDTAIPPRAYQDVNITLFETSAPYTKISSSVVNLTAWTSFYLESTKDYNMSVWYGEPLTTLRIRKVNTTDFGIPGIYWFTFAASHAHQFDVIAGGTAKAPTYLLWGTQPAVICYWDEILKLNISLSSSEGMDDPIQAVWVNWSIGSSKGNFYLDLGNNTVSIPASALGPIPQGKGSASFVISIDAKPTDFATYAKPATVFLVLTVKAIPLRPQYSASTYAYWGYDATLWIELADNRTSVPYEQASFSVKIDGNPTNYEFTHTSNGNYTLTNATAFGLAIGGHTFQVYLAMDNYTFAEGQSTLQMIVVTLLVEYIPTNIPEVHLNFYDEVGQLQLGSTNVYWHWAFELNVSYDSGVDGSPVSDANVYIRFYKSTFFVVETIANYNSSIGTYFALLNTTTFTGAGIYAYSVAASKAGHVSQTVLSTVIISWRPILIEFSTNTYDSLKGAFGGSSSTQVEVRLKDKLAGSLLSGASVSYTWAYGRGNFTEVGEGVYRANVSAEQNVPVGVYDMTVIVNRTNYEEPAAIAKMNIDFTGGHVVLPIFGVVPMTLFVIVLASVVAVGSIGGLRAYIWANTPYIVRQINRILRTVDKGLQAEPIKGIKTRAETPLTLLLSELEASGISPEKAVVTETEVTKEEDTEEIEPEEAEAKTEKAKRKTEKAEAKSESAEVKAEEPEVKPAEIAVKEEAAAVKAKPKGLEPRKPEVKTEDLQFEPEELELGTEQVEAEVEEPESKTEEPETEAKKESISEKNEEDFEQKASEDQETSGEKKPDEGGN